MKNGKSAKSGLQKTVAVETETAREDALPVVGNLENTTIRDLLSYRIHYTANAISRSAMIRFRDEFGISLGEWRTIGLLGASPHMSLNELAKQANLDKGQMSRVVSSLSAAGYINRDDTARSGRTVSLSLTRRGEALYKQLIRVARQREEAFMACLTAEEQGNLFSALTKLNLLAKALYTPATKAPARTRIGRASSSGDV